MRPSLNKGFLTLPGAIVFAAALIAIALIWINRPAGNSASSNSNTPATAGTNSSIPDVTSKDHILGNPNAPVKLIEYSDLSCPYCKMFNPTMTEIMNAYGPTGKVAWIYRSFPLFKPIDGQIPHPNSLQQAEALECVAQLGGNKAFFAFEKKWFMDFPETAAGRPAADDRKIIDSTARDAGVDAVSFNECMAAGRYRTAIDTMYEDGLKAGINGTPLTILVTPSGNKIPLVGVQTYATLKTTIDTLLSNGTPTQ